MNYDINHIKSNLKKLRLNKGITQKKVCAELAMHGCWIDRSTYAKYETGERVPSIEALIALAVCFETTTDYILGLTDNPECR